MAKLNGWVIAVGTPFTGLNLFGPFSSETEAITWGENQYPTTEWCTVKLNKPGKLKKPKRPRVVAIPLKGDNDD